VTLKTTYLATRALLVVALSALGSAGTAFAIGFELAPPGARDTGRAGASAVGADTAIGLFYNPATLLAPSSRTDTALALHMGITDVCFTRQAVLEDGSGARSAGPRSAEICSDAKTAYIPVGASSYRFGKKFALGLGVYSPPAAGRDLSFGSARTGTPDGNPAASSSQLSPSRYMLLGARILQTFPTVGAAWAPWPWLRLGASFGWGFTRFSLSTASFSRAVVSTTPVEIGATTDVSTDVSGKDGFTPRVQAGAWVQPFASIPLELGLSFTYTGDIEASDAKLRLRNLYTDYYPSTLIGLIGGVQQPALDATIRGVSVLVPQISTLHGGARYAKKLPVPVGKAGDRLASERFDIEVDFVATFAKRLDTIDATLPSDVSVVVPSPSPAFSDINLMLPGTISLPHHWQNQYGVRVGGDYNVVPGLLAIRAGYSFESEGVKKGYTQLDFFPHKRYGLMLGATVRIIDLIDVSLAYAYFITPDIVNSVQDAALRRTAAGMARAGDDEVVNAGRFTQTASSLVLELGVHL
jgi:long-subunit fatty acid transport protein